MTRRYLGSFVRHEYQCDFCGVITIHDYSATDYENENCIAPSKEPAPQGWLTGKLNNKTYYFDSPEHKKMFIHDWTSSMKDQF